MLLFEATCHRNYGIPIGCYNLESMESLDEPFVLYHLMKSLRYGTPLLSEHVESNVAAEDARELSHTLQVCMHADFLLQIGSLYHHFTPEMLLLRGLDKATLEYQTRGIPQARGCINLYYAY